MSSQASGVALIVGAVEPFHDSIFPAGRLTSPRLPSCAAAGEPKMRSASLAVAVLAVSAFLPGAQQAIAADGFDLVVLGALGGIEDGNRLASLIHPHGDDRPVASGACPLVDHLRA